ncbi:MAG: hypothetical protein JST36_02575 [Bacteroidetes bacterium]|nr:hypothetical protein [Bacteroidota bacterium]
MVSDPNGTNIKAIVWGEGDVAAGGSIGAAGIFVEDGAGNSSTISLPNGAKQPDVALDN